MRSKEAREGAAMLWGEIQEFIGLSIGVHAGYAVFSEASSKVISKNRRELAKLNRVMDAMKNLAVRKELPAEIKSIATLHADILAPLIARNDESGKRSSLIQPWVRFLSTAVCLAMFVLLVVSCYRYNQPIGFASPGAIFIFGSAVAVAATLYHAGLSISARWGLPRELRQLRSWPHHHSGGDRRGGDSGVLKDGQIA